VEVENSYGKRMADGKVKDRLHQKLKPGRGGKGPAPGKPRGNKSDNEKPINVQKE
jgi:hypothetical protein